MNSRSEKTFKKKFSLHACSVLVDLRKSGQLCDGTIVVDGQEFAIHRAILAASSPYFRSLFTNELKKVSNQIIQISDVSPFIMDLIIEYSYTRDITVTCETVLDILNAADFFMIDCLVKECFDFILKQIDTTNVIGFWKYSTMKNYHLLEQRTFHFLLEHFDGIVGCDEFMSLSHQELQEILKSDNLNVKEEKFVFEALISWLQGDPSERVQFLSELLQCLRIGHLHPDYFMEKVKSNEYVKKEPTCRPRIILGIKYLFDLGSSELSKEELDSLTKKRLPHEILFLFGGWTNDHSITSTMETYDTRANKWVLHKDLTSSESGRAHHGMVAMEECIYVIGGFDEESYLNSVRCFDVLSKQWSEKAPMNNVRCYTCAATMDGYIYAISGYDGNRTLHSVERYLPAQNQWSLISSLQQPRADAGASTLYDKIYVCGGYNGEECLNTVECYSPDTNQWTMVNPMSNRRKGVTVVTFHGQLYTLGGFNGVTRITTCECFDPLDDAKWKKVTDLHDCRSNMASAVIDDMIFVIAGYSELDGNIKGVECFDSGANMWADAEDINVARSGAGACIVRGLPNTEDYIYHPFFQDTDTDV